MSPEKAQLQYLKKYAEAEVEALAGIEFQSYAHCLVVPAHREQPESVQMVWPHPDPQLLLIVVVNSWNDDDVISQNLLHCLTTEPGQKSKNLHYIRRSWAPDLLIVDRCQSARLIPRRQGVGLARKIGCDLALALICRGVIQSTLINSTDADAVLPASYFALIEPNTATAALLQPFVHDFTAEMELASRLYDIAMAYYVRGLIYAGSKYAFHTLGSTLRINSIHYARVRGFPCRNAAEDFYILNKLAKTGRIQVAQGDAINIQARYSDRAPFGTGPALHSINSLASPLTEYRVYDPRVFNLLKIFLTLADQMLDQDPAILFEAHPEILAWVNHSKLSRLVDQHQERKSQDKVFQRFLRDWFDAFQTLKFIHFMRDHYIPSISLDSACSGLVLPEVQIQSLESLRWLHKYLTQTSESDP